MALLKYRIGNIMRIQSKLNANVGITLEGKRVVFPAMGVLELDDKAFAAFVPFIAKRVKLGKFVWQMKPALSEEAQAKADAKALEEAKALVSKSSKSVSKGA